MKILAVSHLNFLQEIIATPIYVGYQAEALCWNMWCISLERDLVQTIVVQDLVYFVNKLVATRKHQLQGRKITNDVTFYMWFDKQALQLRFSLTSAAVSSLPFQCKVNLIDIPEPILKDFIDTVKQINQFGDDVEVFEVEDSAWDEDDDMEYVLDVFVQPLHLISH